MENPIYPKLAKYMEDQFVKYRMKHGFMKSQSDFAAWIGISQANINRYINGVQMPSIPKIIKIAEKLGPEIYDVLDLQRPMPKDKMLNEMMNDWHILNSDQKKSIFQEFTEHREIQRRHADNKINN